MEDFEALAEAPAEARSKLKPTVVAVGSSAGGLEALRALLHRLPRSGQFSYVIAQHLSPTHLSMLTTLLSRETSLPVHQVEDGMSVEPATIYVTPPNADVVYQGGQFRLQPPSERGPKPSIDTLLFSLARSIPERTIAVILSGSGSDGSIGARQLKGAGGYLIVQEPKSAEYPSMPEAALGTGMADAILVPEDVGPFLEKLDSGAAAKPVRLSRRQSEVDQVLERINVCAGIDFRGYKTNTIYRRIQQRITATRSSGMADYLNLLDENHEEIQTLAQNCLISVTSFFRDKSAFDELGRVLMKRIPAESSDPVRAWAAGCATGEEAYTLSMALASWFPSRRIQIFATDLDESAISFARKAIYAAPSVRDIPTGFLARHLTESVQGYTVDRATRERVVFARHDIVRDPLFLNLDLVCCRNVLIYFRPALQEEIFLKFHHALKPGGVLFLGRSENAVGDFFELEDRKNRIFINKPLGENERHLPVVREWQGLERAGEASTLPSAAGNSLLRDALVNRFAPRAVLIDENYRILETYGDLNGLLSIPEGRANFTLLNLLPKALAVVVRALLQKAMKDEGGAAQGSSRTYSFGRKKSRLEVSVAPLAATSAGRSILVAFRDVTGRGATTDSPLPAPSMADGQIEELERELQSTRECLQATVEELETSNEELQALNEEMQASNEELQASNEELHASNEELQSTNEELLTVNEEIEHKSIELAFLIEDLENIQNSLDGPLLVADARGYLRHVNEEARRLFGLSAEHLSGPILLPNDPGLATQLASRVHKVIETGEALEFRSVSVSRRYRILVRPYVGRHKANRGAVVVFHDITQIVGVNDRLKRSEQRVRMSGARHEATLNSLPANIAVLDARGTIVAVNAAWKRFGAENGSIEKRHGVGRNYLSLCEKTPDVHARAIAEGMRKVLAGDTGEFSHEYPCHSPIERRWFRCLVSRVTEEGAVVMHFNITEQKLREERFSFRLGALDAAPYPTFTADGQGIIDWANPSFVALVGSEPGRIAGRHASSFEVPGNAQGLGWLFQQARAAGGTAEAELRLAGGNGEPRTLRFSVAALNNPGSGELRFVAAGADLTEQRQSEARMLHSAEHDELTGLLNRKSIIARLERAISRQREAGGQVALLFLDLDRFKDTNDTLGHLAGDQILVEAANRLRANVPIFSNLARFGGDEFVIFVERPGAGEDVDLLVERLLLAFSKPVMVEGRPLQATASVGVAFFPHDASTAEDLVSRADLAMYRAKADGRRAYRRFDQQIQKEIQERVLIERDLARAITLKDLWVAFQPQIDLRNGRVIGAEALLRWNHPEAQQIPISKVISIAEESGLILPIGQWVIREAVQQLARWRTIDPGLRLSVNLSAVQFNQQDVFAQIMEQLQHFAIPANKLKVEITESVLLNRSSRVRETLHALHGAGIGLHLDDFGTGYSSLSYLQQFPIEAVKIDSSFLLGVGRDRQDEAIVDAIVKLAHSLRIGAVAEGVENETQLNFLEQAGCEIAQGYHWAKALGAEQFADFLLAKQAAPEMSFVARA